MNKDYDMPQGLDLYERKIRICKGAKHKPIEYFVKSNVLDKIRAEIDGIEINGQIDEHTLFIRSGQEVKKIALEIIDKYKKGVDE